MQANQNSIKNTHIPDYEQLPNLNISQISHNSIDIYHIQNAFHDLVQIQQAQSFVNDDDFGGSFFIHNIKFNDEKVKFNDEDLDISFSDDEEYKKKEEGEYKKKEEEKYKEKEKEEKFNYEKEDLSQNNKSIILDEDYYKHPSEDRPEKNFFDYSEFISDKECPTLFEKSNIFGEKISSICNNMSKKENFHQDDIQKLNKKKKTERFFNTKKISKEKAEEQNLKNFSRIEDKRGNKIYIPNNENNSSLNNKNSNIFIHEDSEVKIDIPQQIINSNQIKENHNFFGFHNSSEIKINFKEKPILNNKNSNIFINDDSDIKIDIPQQIINSNHIKENHNISGFHNDGEILINIKEKPINSKQNKIKNNSTLKCSTGDSSQKNSLNISEINKYKYPFKVIFEPDALVALNKSSENLYVNFKRKRESVRKAVNNHKHIKKAEDLEKLILRKFKAYIRLKKKNGIKEIKNIIDKDLNFWGSFLKNNKPFKFIQKGGKEKTFNSYGKSLMDFIFSRDDVDDLYSRFASDESYFKQLSESFDKKSEGYKQAYSIALKNLNKKYNNKYKEEDLDLKYVENS